ncbi:YjjG family noncanonical pyrimidine nucleotidase [Viscerimonas tarda]
MKYKAILFDLDHTLLDTAQNNRDAIEEIYCAYSFGNYYEKFDEFYAVYSPHNLKLWDAYERKLVTKDDMMNLRFYTPFRHIEGLTAEKAFEINTEYLARVALKTKVIDGAFELLDELKAHFPMHILSNGFTEVQYKKMDSAGLSPYFDKVILSDCIGVNKPDPALFHHALKEIGEEASNVVMVGDNWNSDIMGAKAGNIDQIWYNPERNEPGDFVPTHTVEQLAEITKIVIE